MGAGSNNKDENMVAEPVVTPTSKGLGKRDSEYGTTQCCVNLLNSQG
jgi:hypothetical protein